MKKNKTERNIIADTKSNEVVILTHDQLDNKVVSVKSAKPTSFDLSNTVKQLASTINTELGLIIMCKDGNKLVYKFDLPANNDFKPLIDEITQNISFRAKIVASQFGTCIKRSKTLSKRKVDSINFVSKSQILQSSIEFRDVAAKVLHNPVYLESALQLWFESFKFELEHPKRLLVN